MKKYRFISFIALAIIAVTGCEWNSSNYDTYVTDNHHVTTCPGTFVDNITKNGISACNMVKIGNLYCGPATNDKVDLIVLNEDGTLYCATNDETYDCNKLDTEEFKAVQKYPSEYQTCMDFRKHGLFDGLTTDCLDEANNTVEKIEALKVRLAAYYFIFEEAEIDYDPLQNVFLPQDGVCPKDYPVCYYDGVNIGCMKYCGNELCNPKTHRCNNDEVNPKCVDYCNDECNESQECKKNENGKWACIERSYQCNPPCDLNVETCMKNSEERWECIRYEDIVADFCNNTCDPTTSYCAKIGEE